MLWILIFCVLWWRLVTQWPDSASICICIFNLPFQYPWLLSLSRHMEVSKCTFFPLFLIMSLHSCGLSLIYGIFYPLCDQSLLVFQSFPKQPFPRRPLTRQKFVSCHSFFFHISQHYWNFLLLSINPVVSEGQQTFKPKAKFKYLNSLYTKLKYNYYTMNL